MLISSCLTGLDVPIPKFPFIKVLPLSLSTRNWSTPLADSIKNSPLSDCNFKRLPLKVNFASASKVLAVLDPVISLLSALLFIVVPAGMLTVSNVGSAPLFARRNYHR